MDDKYKMEFNLIKEILAKNKIDEAISQLLTLLEELQEKSLLREARTISANYEAIKGEVRKFGEIDSTLMSKSRIVSSLLSIVDKIEIELPNLHIQKQNLDVSNDDDEHTCFENNFEPQVGALLMSIDKLYEQLRSRTPQYDWLKYSEEDYNRIQKKWIERRFQVVVMALMKSGKSTLLNSWIGREYLPSANTAETMQVIKIRHNPKRDEGVLIKDQKIIEKGAKQIKKYIQNLNNEQRKKTIIDNEQFCLEVNIASLKDKDLNGYGFDFLDTPGVNEDGVPTLQAKVKFLIDSSDVIIYLLDYTKLKTNDEKIMFESLKKWRTELFSQLKSRLFFVVNKVDKVNRHDRDKGMSVNTIPKYIQKMLKETLELNIEVDSIIPVSAESALLGYLVQQNTASTSQLQDFKNRAFGEIGAEFATPENYQKAALKLIEKSGIIELKGKVLDTIYNKRSIILIRSVIDDAQKILEQLMNYIEIGKRTLVKEVDNIKELRVKINSILEGLNSIQEESSFFKKKAHDIVQKKFLSFQKALKKSVVQTFKDTTGAKPRYPWLKLIPGTSNYQIIDKNPQVLREKISIINSTVYYYIHNNYERFFTELAEIQQTEFSKYRSRIESKVNPLVQKIEKVIGEALDIRLYPKKIQIPLPSLEYLYWELEKHVNSIVTTNEKSNMNWLESIFNSVLQLLGFGQKEVYYNEYGITSKEYLKKVWEQLEPVNQTIGETAEEFVERKYLDAIDSAESTIRFHAIGYIQTMENEINMKEVGEVDIPQRIENMNIDLVDTKNNLDQLLNIKSDLTR